MTSSASALGLLCLAPPEAVQHCSSASTPLKLCSIAGLPSTLKLCSMAALPSTCNKGSVEGGAIIIVSGAAVWFTP